MPLQRSVRPWKTMPDDAPEQLDWLRAIQAETAHQLNNDLTVITGNAALIAQAAETAYQQTGDERWQRIAEDIADIRSAAAHSTELVRRLSATAHHDQPSPEE